MKKSLMLLLSLLVVACGGEKDRVEEKEIAPSEEKEIVQEVKESLKIKSVSTTGGKNPSVDIAFNENIATENLKSYIKITPNIEYKVLKMREHLIITGNFDTNSEYEIELLKGIKGEKSLLEENLKESIKFKDVEPKLTFSNEGIILPKVNKNRVSFKSINVKRVNLKVKKIFLNNTTQFLQDFIFKGNGNIFSYYVQSNLYKVGETVFEKSYDLDYKKNVWEQNEIALENLTNDKGVYIVELSFDKDGIDYKFPEGVEEWQRESFFEERGKIGKALLISDMGIVAQKERDNKLTVNILDIVKNKPIESIEVKAISVNNQVISEKKSDKNGEVTFENGDKIFYVLAQSKDEISILKLSDSKLSYDGFLVDGEYRDGDIRAFIYSDRGVYRPGDRVNIGIIARNGDKIFPEGQPIKIDVFTARGDKYIDGEIVKNGKNGFFTYSFDTKKESETGVWEVTVYVGGEKDKKFSLKIPVESIVPYKIEVGTEFPDKVSDGVNISGDITAQYLFGAPAENLKYSSELTIREKSVEFERYKKFTFSNPTTYITDIRMVQKGELDSEGKGKIEFNLSKNIPKNLSLNGEIVTRVIEPSGRPVIAIDNVKINSFDSYVGIENPEDRYVKSGDSINLQVVAVSEDGERLVSDRKLKYRVYKNEYSWWWDYYNYNTFLKSIKTDKNSVLLYEKEIITTDKPYIIDYQIEGSGEVFVEVEDTETKQSAGINLYVSTWQDSSISKKIDKLKIESDKKEYNVGDKAKITFEGEKGTRALITLEKSGKILKRYWKDIEGTTNTVEFDVDKELFPNGYVTVTLFQKYANSNNDRPIRLYGAVPIVVRDESKRLEISLDTPVVLKPNEKFRIGVEANKKMDYTVSVVDEGLLQITNFKTPNPYEYFYQKEGLQLTTYDNYSEIIGRSFGDVNQVLTVGGDGYLMSNVRLDKSANSFGFEQSERFEPLAIYRGVLTTDERGKGSVELELPNYTGAIRIMVTGASEESYGMAQKRVEVKAPIIANISMSRVLKVGDEFQTSIRVFATEENLGEIDLAFEFLGRRYIKALKLKKGESKDVVFNIKVGDEIGNKEAKLKIKSPNYSSEESINIDVTSDNPYTYINDVEYVKDEKSFEFPKESVKGSSNGKVIVSSSPILAIDNRLKELIRYPYGCIEQTISTLFPQLFIDSLSDSKELSREQIVKNINGGIAKLSGFQLPDGSFSYWAGSSDGDLWATNYVGHFMVIAKDKGYYIPESLYKSWLNFAIEKSKDSSYNVNLKAYTLYVLALGGEAQIGEMNYLYDNNLSELDDISKWYLASAYAIIGEDDIAKSIANKLSTVVKEKPFDYYVDSYGSKLRDEAIVLNSYYTVYGKIDKKLYEDILKTLQSQNWLSTQSIGYSLMSIAQVVKGSEGKEVSGKLIVDGKEIDFKDKSGVWEYSQEGMKSVKIIGKDIYVNRYWEGIPINYTQADESRNIKIERKFYDDNGEEIDVKSLEKGRAFYMELKVLPADDVKGYFYLDNIALTQIIPSGWEIENTRLLNTNLPQWIEEKIESSNLEYEDIRDDRVNFFFDFNNYDRKGQSFFIKLNSVTKGKYKLPGTKAEGMYNNEYRAYLNGFDVEVK